MLEKQFNFVRYDMKVIYGDRQTGKTWDAIKTSIKTGIPLITHDEGHAKHMLRIAREEAFDGWDKLVVCRAPHRRSYNSNEWIKFYYKKTTLGDKDGYQLLIDRIRIPDAMISDDFFGLITSPYYSGEIFTRLKYIYIPTDDPVHYDLMTLDEKKEMDRKNFYKEMKGMTFKEAFEAMKRGASVKMPEWAGYWKWEDSSIKMYSKYGGVIDLRDSPNMNYTMGFITRDDWVIVDTPLTQEELKDLNIRTFAFGEALRRLKAGEKVTRKGWNGKGLFVVYQKGYPDGIPCNKQTAEAWGINEGDLFKVEPYLQINTVDGSHAMWVPSIRDCLAEDWEVVE